MISWFHFNFIIDFSWLSFSYLSSTGEAQPILLPSLPTHRAQLLPTTHHTVDHLNTPWIHSPANLNPNWFSNQTPCGAWPPWMDEQMSTQSLRGNIECWKGLGDFIWDFISWVFKISTLLFWYYFLFFSQTTSSQLWISFNVFLYICLTFLRPSLCCLPFHISLHFL